MALLALVALMVTVLPLGGMAGETTGINNHYEVPVGTHVVSFNTSVPLAEYENVYNPTYPSDGYYTSVTFLEASKNEPSLLTVEVRDFKHPIPQDVQELEADTLYDFMGYYTARYFPNSKPVYGTYDRYTSAAIVMEEKLDYCGKIIDWPSNQTEIVITGSLPSIELWKDILHSLKLER